MDKPYISSSQLMMYERCGEQYRRRYMEGEILPPSIALLRGTGVHTGAKENFRQKIESHKDMKKKDIVDLSVSMFEERVESDGISLDKEEKKRGKDIVIGEGKDVVASLSELYADEVAPVYQPVQVEEKQRIILPGSHDLLAVMDLADDKGIVVDLKTTTRKKNPKEVIESEQLTFYALVFKALNGNLPKQVRLEILISKKEKERQMLFGKRTDKDLQTLVNRINTMIDAVSKGVFMPCNQNSWQCSQKYCGYFKTCHYVA